MMCLFRKIAIDSFDQRHSSKNDKWLLIPYFLKRTKDVIVLFFFPLSKSCIQRIRKISVVTRKLEFDYNNKREESKSSAAAAFSLFLSLFNIKREASKLHLTIIRVLLLPLLIPATFSLFLIRHTTVNTRSVSLFEISCKVEASENKTTVWWEQRTENKQRRRRRVVVSRRQVVPVECWMLQAEMRILTQSTIEYSHHCMMIDCTDKGLIIFRSKPNILFYHG